ncbi:MAG: ammonia channel protein, partial [Actinomycetota bacterium]
DISVNDGGVDGLFYGGGADLLIDQTVAALSVMAYSFVVTFIIAKVIDGTMGLRIEEVAERVGLDQSQHAESAYQA